MQYGDTSKVDTNYDAVAVENEWKKVAVSQQRYGSHHSHNFKPHATKPLNKRKMEKHLLSMLPKHVRDNVYHNVIIASEHWGSLPNECVVINNTLTGFDFVLSVGSCNTIISYFDCKDGNFEKLSKEPRCIKHSYKFLQHKNKKKIASLK